MKLLKTTLVATTALCLGISAAFADGLNARINTGQVAQGDSFQLTLTTDGSGGAAPDLAPLSQHFDVLGTSQSSQTQIINGRMSQSTSWIVTLSPRSKGAVTIPSLSAGALSSDPVTVDVIDASQQPKLQGASGIAVKATINDGDHYRFQEIPLTVRIESSQPLQSAELIAPTGPFELTQTGQDRQGQINRDGQPVTLIERSYLLRPETEGTLIIPPFQLRGAVQDPNARRSGFGGRDPFAMMDQMMGRMGGMGNMRSPFESMFNPGTPFVARSEAISLDVLANPNADGSDWFLPAKAVKLQAAWSPETPTFREGEAVTRRISLLALGARPEQLPDLSFGEPDGARIYLDDVETDMLETDEGTVARRDFVISIVPTRGGDVILPEISVDWLETVTGETRTANLATQTISVKGMVPAKPAPPVLTDAGIAASAQGSAFERWWPLGGVPVVLAGIGFLLWRRRVTEPSQSSSRQMPRPDPLQGLRRAAKVEDVQGFYKDLLALRGRPDLADPVRVEHAVVRLGKVAYAQDASVEYVDLKSMLTALTACSTRKSGVDRRDNNRILPPLYPAART